MHAWLQSTTSHALFNQLVSQNRWAIESMLVCLSFTETLCSHRTRSGDLRAPELDEITTFPVCAAHVAFVPACASPLQVTELSGQAVTADPAP